MIGLPPLDCHAHIASDVTARQLARLAPAIVFAVTRSPREAEAVSLRSDQRVIWGCEVHPSYVAKGGEVDMTLLRSLVPGFALLGEIGLDRRSGHLDRQTQVLTRLLEVVKDEPVLLSLHSSGCVEELLALLETHPHPGSVLHWFTGDERQVARAARLGCYFSVNTSMKESLLRQIPFDRLLPETDYPVSRASKDSLPGDTGHLEKLIAQLHNTEREAVRAQWYKNLRTVSLATGAVDRMPRTITDLLLVA